jgi:hypothetical protein
MMGSADMARRTPSRSGGALLLVALTASGAAAAADASPVPEDFLEYLGSWESDDADWLVARAAVAAAAPPAAPAPTQPQPTTAQRGAAPPPATTERKP